MPASPGVPAGYAQNTLVAPYNDSGAVRQVFERYPGEIAAVIVEPVAANMGVVPPRPGFLADLREITGEFGALLIFDEVITGFRVARGGAQALYDVKPDLTCLGKIIGGGLPVGAYGGRREIMEMMAPSGPVYQAGTLSGNPLVMTAGIETLEILSQPGIYDRLEDRAADLERGIVKAAAGSGVGLSVARVASLITAFFTAGSVVDYASARRADTSRFAAFFRRLLSGGIYWPPSQFEAAFVSLAHTDNDIQTTIDRISRALRDLAAS
jgi:glutamate-1-semialdehyde 2,1-aminomutase